MERDQAIAKLISYALDKELIQPEEKIWAVNALLEAKGLEPGAASVDWQAYAQQQYDKLAAGLRASLDMKRIYRILNGEE